MSLVSWSLRPASFSQLVLITSLGALTYDYQGFQRRPLRYLVPPTKLKYRVGIFSVQLAGKRSNGDLSSGLSWHADAWKRRSCFRLPRGGSGMSLFTGMANPEELAIMTEVYEDHCL